MNRSNILYLAVGALAVVVAVLGYQLYQDRKKPEGVNINLGPGGISGPPVARRSLEVLRRLHARVGGRLVLISAGGIETTDDAWERITAGASLLQGYTGFVYGGGLWAKHIHDGLAERVRAGGFSGLADAVGSAVPPRA